MKRPTCWGGIVVASIVPGAWGQASLTGIGVLNFGPGSASDVTGMSGDGRVVVGTATGQWPAGHAFRWTSRGGIQDLGELPGMTVSTGRATNHDGSVVVGHSGPRGFRWTIAGGMEELLPRAIDMQPLHVSGDGLVIVGMRDRMAFRWTQATGVQTLPTPPCPGIGGEAIGTNADGSVVVGLCGGAFRWTMQHGFELLLGSSASYAVRTNADGSVIIGARWLASGEPRGVRWTGAGTVVEDVGPAIPGGNCWATCLSADGTVVGGYCVNNHGPIFPYLWTRRGGTVEVGPYLAAHGVDLTGWTPTSVMGMSADGTMIAGSGRHGSRTEGWIARLPLGCYANCDGSTDAPALNVADYVCFLSRYGAGDGYANCDGSTAPPVLNVNDFVCFQARFAAGCV